MFAPSLLPSTLQRMASLGKPPSSLTVEAKDRFRTQQLEGVQRHVVRAAVINCALAALLAAFLAPTFGSTATRAWLAVKLAVSVVRVLTALAQSRTHLRADRYLTRRRLTLVLLALDGAVWGAAGAWCSFGPSEIACLACAVLCSVALMATHGFTTMSAAAVSYAVAMLAPLAVAALFRGDAIGVFVAAGSVLVLLQSVVTSLSSERRLRHEFLAHEKTEQARLREVEHAEALSAALLEVKRQGAVKSLFLGTMSHELRTPLHGILGLTQLVRQQTTDRPAAQHQLALVESSGRHLLELIGSLLDISRIEAGRFELHVSAFDLSKEVAEVAELYRLRCESKGLEFQFSSPIGSACRVEGDAARLRQVLHNLLGNAVKFTRSGFVTLTVRREGGFYSFEVKDTGAGIASKDLAHIFDAFRQADDSATRPADGTGLGLTIAREIAQAMSGDIVVSSALGVGSRFTFTAVLASAAAELTAERSDPKGVTTPRLRLGYRVLIAEDNDVNALIVTANLTNIGAHVTRAVDGREAIDAAFVAPRPEFILMDCRMPGVDGPTAAREIRAIEKRRGLSGVPIVALTASPNEEDRRDCYDAGMNGILAKPFTQEQLLQTIALHASGEVCDHDHPLYEYAKSLDDSDSGLCMGSTVH